MKMHYVNDKIASNTTGVLCLGIPWCFGFGKFQKHTSGALVWQTYLQIWSLNFLVAKCIWAGTFFNYGILSVIYF